MTAELSKDEVIAELQRKLNVQHEYILIVENSDYINVHKPNCSYALMDDKPCDCGFAELSEASDKYDRDIGPTISMLNAARRHAAMPRSQKDWREVHLTAGEIADAILSADTFEKARNYICDAALAKIK